MQRYIDDCHTKRDFLPARDLWLTPTFLVLVFTALIVDATEMFERDYLYDACWMLCVEQASEATRPVCFWRCLSIMCIASQPLLENVHMLKSTLLSRSQTRWYSNTAAMSQFVIMHSASVSL